MTCSTRAAALILFSSIVGFGCGGDEAPGGGPLTADEFITSFAQIFCEKVRACDAWSAAYTQAECEELVAADLAAEAALDSGAIVLDPDAAEGCLALLAAGPACAAEPAANDYCFEEGGAFVGTTPAGGACDSDAAWLCAPGTECSAEPSSGACGTCVAVTVGDLGEPCVSTANCRQTATTLAYCDYDPADGRDECVAWNPGHAAGLGEDCVVDFDAYCDVGLECDYDLGECVAQIALGEECDPNADPGCVGYTPCVEDAGSSLGGYCRALVVAREVGDECGLVGTDWVECSVAHGLFCDPGTDLCAEFAEPGLDDSCADADCAAGLYCDYSDYTCATLLADGVACDEHYECASGLCFGANGSAVCGDAESVDTACAP